MIKEVIVVEGKDDIDAVKKAVDAEVISTNGFGYKRELIDILRNIADRRGIIILTDPDYAGEQIRKDLSKHIKNAKHAFLPQSEAIKNARPNNIERAEEFKKEELLRLGFIGKKDSKEKREQLGAILGIGYSNSKQLLNRLNNFGIKRSEFEKAIERIENDGK